MAEREGAEFAGRVNGVGRFGLFVKLEETGADGLVPISSLGREYFHHDPDSQTLTGERTGKVLAIGMHARVRLREADPVTGGLVFELLEASGLAPRKGPRKGGGPKRALQRARLAKAKAKRKERRRR
jgi:ribonuclease R